MKKLLIVFLSLTLCMGVFLPMSASAEQVTEPAERMQECDCHQCYVTAAWLCCRNVQKA